MKFSIMFIHYKQCTSICLDRWISCQLHAAESWEANSHYASQEIPHIYGTQRFITVFTRACHRSVSWVRWIQTTSSHPISL